MVSRLLGHCASYIANCPNAFDGQAVAAVMTGLKSSNMSRNPALSVAKALIKNLQDYPPKVHMTAKELSIAMNGLQGSTVQDSAALVMLKIFNGQALALQESSKTVFSTGNEIAATLNGLKNFDCEDQEVTKALQIVCASLKHSPYMHFQEKELFSAFFALQNLHCDAFDETSVACEIVSLLAVALSKYQGKLSGRAVSNILYGLQNMKQLPPALIK